MRTTMSTAALLALPFQQGNGPVVRIANRLADFAGHPSGLRLASRQLCLARQKQGRNLSLIIVQRQLYLAGLAWLRIRTTPPPSRPCLSHYAAIISTAPQKVSMG
jgi:hypothetical protein